MELARDDDLPAPNAVGVAALSVSRSMGRIARPQVLDLGIGYPFSRSVPTVQLQPVAGSCSLSSTTEAL